MSSSQDGYGGYLSIYLYFIYIQDSHDSMSSSQDGYGGYPGSYNNYPPPAQAPPGHPGIVGFFYNMNSMVKLTFLGLIFE